MSTKRRRAGKVARSESPLIPRSRLSVLTSLLALSMLTACSRGCSHKSGKHGTVSPPSEVSGQAQPPKAPPGVQPRLRYVEQRLGDGKFMDPLAPPDAAPQAKTEPSLPDLPPINKHGRVPAPKEPAGNTPAARSRSRATSSPSTASTRTTSRSSTRRSRSSPTGSCTAARWCSPAS